MYVTICEYVYINFFSAEWSLEHFGNDFLKMVWPISPFVQRYFCMPEIKNTPIKYMRRKAPLSAKNYRWKIKKNSYLACLPTHVFNRGGFYLLTGMQGISLCKRRNKFNRIIKNYFRFILILTLSWLVILFWYWKLA